MNDGATGKVQITRCAQPTAAPDPVAEWRVDADRPEDGKDQKCTELHALGEGANDQRRGNDGERSLKHREEQRGDGFPFPGGQTDPGKPHVVEPSDQTPVVGAEGQSVADQDPHQREYAHAGQALHQDAQHVGPADQAAVEERQSRSRHHDDESCRDQHPGRIARIEGSFLSGGHAWQQRHEQSAQGRSQWFRDDGSFVWMPHGWRMKQRRCREIAQ